MVRVTWTWPIFKFWARHLWILGNDRHCLGNGTRIRHNCNIDSRTAQSRTGWRRCSVKDRVLTGLCICVLAVTAILSSSDRCLTHVRRHEQTGILLQLLSSYRADQVAARHTHIWPLSPIVLHARNWTAMRNFTVRMSVIVSAQIKYPLCGIMRKLQDD